MGQDQFRDPFVPRGTHSNRIPRVYEWRVTRHRMGLTVRFWISQDVIPNPHAAKQTADDAAQKVEFNSINDFASRVMEYSEAFNSVEVCDDNGDGVCVHRDWP